MEFREATDVADSTDWLETSLACVMPVEQAFRCHVCKDFYNSPMMTSCNHTFCSLCIRRCLSVDGRCPLCRMSDQESKLRGNWALREAIDAFCKARPTILEVARKPLPAPPLSQPVVEATSAAGAVGGDGQVSSPKRKAESDVWMEDDATSGGGQQAKRTRTSQRLSKTKAAAAVTAMAQETQLVIELDGGPRGADQTDTEYQPDDGLVACPICWKRMKPWQVDRHLDTSCSSSPQKPKSSAIQTSTTAVAAATARTATAARGGGLALSAWQQRSVANPFAAASSVTGAAAVAPPERMPSLSYSLLSDTALRKKMAALGLSTAGPRQLLERRHKEWTTLWNANCDSARPKRKADLLHDLDVWERTVGAETGGTGGSGGGGGGAGGGPGGGLRSGSTLVSRSVAASSLQAAQIRDKEFDGAAWSAKHNSSFKDLIANAKRSRLKAPGVGDAPDESNAVSMAGAAKEASVTAETAKGATPETMAAEESKATEAAAATGIAEVSAVGSASMDESKVGTVPAENISLAISLGEQAR